MMSLSHFSFSSRCSDGPLAEVDGGGSFRGTPKVLPTDLTTLENQNTLLLCRKATKVVLKYVKF
jgi:hypothetical protein